MYQSLIEECGMDGWSSSLAEIKFKILKMGHILNLKSIGPTAHQYDQL